VQRRASLFVVCGRGAPILALANGAHINAVNDPPTARDFVMEIPQAAFAAVGPPTI
jgi:hypothetical protein